MSGQDQQTIAILSSESVATGALGLLLKSVGYDTRLLEELLWRTQASN